MDTLNYLRNFFDDKNVASITPTSRYGIKRLLKRIDFSNAQTILEYGPGGGAITEAILSQMKGDTRFVVIETNQHFVDSLIKRFTDPRLTIVHDSAENVKAILTSMGLTDVDYVVSGIPFSLFPNQLKDRILESTNAVLSKRGRFLVYQFLVSLSHGNDDIKRKLDEHLELVDRDFELLCLPPLRIFEAGKRLTARA